jgi:ABC-2 type transport system ATP-binding protein
MMSLDLRTQRDEIRRRIGVVFQAPSLDVQLSAEENLRYHGRLYGLKGAELQNRIDDLLEQVGLTERRYDRVGKFSGGMRRRVELAKGLLNRPRLLLLDEPSTGLDLGARIDLWRYLMRIRERDGTTILVTTHLMEEAERCDRLAILYNGHLVACDTPTALKSSIGGEVVTIRAQEPDALAESIGRQFEIATRRVGDEIRLEQSGGHLLVPRLIEAFPGRIQTVSVGQPTLEDVFIRQTGRALEDTAVSTMPASR